MSVYKDIKGDLNLMMEILVDLAEAYFRQGEAVEFLRYNVHFGIYREVGRNLGYSVSGTPFYPPIGPDKSIAERIGFQMRYRLLYTQSARVPDPVDGSLETSGLVLTDFTGIVNPKGFNYHLFTKIILRTDLVYDSLEKMKANRIPFAQDVIDLKRGPRKKTFGEKIPDYMPKEFRNYESLFEDVLENLCTYYDGKYYEKYRDSSKTESNKPEDFSDEFLIHNYKEEILVRDKYYVIIKGEDWSIATILKPPDREKNGLIEVIPHFTIGQPKPDTLVEFIFLYTIDGADAKKTDPPMDLDRSVSLYAYQVSPRYEVTEFIGKENVYAYFASNNLDLHSEEDWFMEFIRLKFSNVFYEYTTEGFDAAVAMPNNLDIFEKALRKIETDFSGPIKDQVEAVRTALKADPKNFVFFQGFPIGESYVFIGNYAGYTYMRHRESGQVLMYEDAKFLVNFRLIHIFTEVYNRTGHLIPICMVLVWGSTFVFGGAISGGHAWLARQLAMEVTTEVAMRKVVPELIKKFKYAIFYLLIDGILKFFPDKGNLPFFRGVFHGIGMSTLNSLIEKYTLALTEGPRYYRWFNMARTALDKGVDIVRLIERYKKKIDDKAADAIEKQLIRVVQKFHEAFLILMPNMLFVEHEDADLYIQATADSTGTAPKTKKEWDYDRTSHLHEVMNSQFEWLEKEWAAWKDKTIKEFLDLNLKDIAPALATATLLGASIAGAGGFVPLAVICLGVFMKVDLTFNDGNATSFLAKAILKPVAEWHLYTPQEKETIGEFMGNLIGAILFDWKMFGKSSKFTEIHNRAYSKYYHSSVKRKACKLFFKGLEGELKHGLLFPIFKMLFAHFFVLYEKYAIPGKASFEAALAKIQEKVAGGPFRAELLTYDERKLSLEDLKKVIGIMLEEIDNAILDLEIADLKTSLATLKAKVENCLWTKTPVPSLSELEQHAVAALWPVEAHLYVLFSCLQKGLKTLHVALDALTENMPGLSFSLRDLMNITDLETKASHEGAVALNLLYPRPTASNP